MSTGRPPARLAADLRVGAGLAGVFWFGNVGAHHYAQEFWAWMAATWGFGSLQRGEAALFVPLLALGLTWVGRRLGLRTALIVLLANVVAAANFVTNAEAVHLVQYAAVYFLWARVLNPRQAFYLTVFLGFCDEAVQWAWLDTVRSARFIDLKDCGLNLVGALNGWAVSRAWASPRS